MPLTAEARVRSQTSLRNICGLKSGGGRFLLQYFGPPPSVSCHRRSALNTIQRSKSGNLKKMLFRKSVIMGRKGILYCLRSATSTATPVHKTAAHSQLVMTNLKGRSVSHSGPTRLPRDTPYATATILNDSAPQRLAIQFVQCLPEVF
jgi:hypothetical protein